MHAPSQNAPDMHLTVDALNVRSMRRWTRLSVHNSMPKPCSVGYRVDCTAIDPIGVGTVGLACHAQQWLSRHRISHHRAQPSMHIPFAVLFQLFLRPRHNPCQLEEDTPLVFAGALHRPSFLTCRISHTKLASLKDVRFYMVIRIYVNIKDE